MEERDDREHSHAPSHLSSRPLSRIMRDAQARIDAAASSQIPPNEAEAHARTQAAFNFQMIHAERLSRGIHTLRDASTVIVQPLIGPAMRPDRSELTQQGQSKEKCYMEHYVFSGAPGRSSAHTAQAFMSADVAQEQSADTESSRGENQIFSKATQPDAAEDPRPTKRRRTIPPQESSLRTPRRPSSNHDGEEAESNSHHKCADEDATWTGFSDVDEPDTTGDAVAATPALKDVSERSSTPTSQVESGEVDLDAQWAAILEASGR